MAAAAAAVSSGASDASASRVVGRPVVAELSVDLLELGDLGATGGSYVHVLLLRALGEVRQSEVFEASGRVALQGRFCFQTAFDAGWETARLRRLLASETLRVELLRVPIHEAAARRRSDLGAERTAAYRLSPWPWLLPRARGGGDGGANGGRSGTAAPSFGRGLGGGAGGALFAEGRGERTARPLAKTSCSRVGIGGGGYEARGAAAASGARRVGSTAAAPTGAPPAAVATPLGADGSTEGPWLRLHMRARVAYEQRRGAAEALEARLLPGRGDIVEPTAAAATPAAACDGGSACDDGASVQDDAEQ